MKTWLTTHGRALSIAIVLLLMLGLLAYVALRAGPLAPVAVRLATVERRAISPSLFGIGTVQARFTHKIGPIAAGRVKQVTVQPGDFVKAGQLLGEMDPVDLNDRIGALDASRKRAEANLLAVEAQLLEAGARATFAQTQAQRYEQLLAVRSVSTEAADIKRQDLQLAQASLSAVRANVDASRQELVRAGADHDGLVRQRANLRLIAPVNGLVTRRDADSGTTVVAGQAVVEVVEPTSLWINVRFDQQRARGLAMPLPAQIVLRSQGGQPLTGRVLRVEPIADAVTEEVLAKIEFNQLHGIQPRSIVKQVRDVMDGARSELPRGARRVAEPRSEYRNLSPEQLMKQIARLEKQMFSHARNLEFEAAAQLRDQVQELRRIGFGLPERKTG